MRTPRLAAAVAAAIVLVSCSDEDPSGPVPADLDGQWSFDTDNLSGNGLSCTITGMLIHFDQSGSTFGGSYTDARMQCWYQGEQVVDGEAAGEITSGKVTGNTVAFDFDTAEFTNTGTLDGDTISGKTIFTVQTPEGAANLVGDFTMARR